LDRQLVEALEGVEAAHFDAARTACDYDALARSAERERLAACLAALESFDVRRAHIPAQTAFWINVFNAAVLRDAPEMTGARSVRDVEGFFERPRVKVGAHGYSLDDIEHGLLRGNVPKYGKYAAPMKKSDPRLAYVPLAFDERLHFALYSACRSSPPLRVLHSERLDVELEEAARAYVRETVRVKDEGARVKVPAMFRWYRDDFGGESGALDFVVARLDEPSVELIDARQGAVKLKYLDFDWTLNRR
jgi:hypothetical protein